MEALAAVRPILLAVSAPAPTHAPTVGQKTLQPNLGGRASSLGRRFGVPCNAKFRVGQETGPQRLPPPSVWSDTLVGYQIRMRARKKPPATDKFRHSARVCLVGCSWRGGFGQGAARTLARTASTHTLLYTRRSTSGIATTQDLVDVALAVLRRRLQVVKPLAQALNVRLEVLDLLAKLVIHSRDRD
ncbi:hypothetical protein GGTG_01282 [Gaeumannomyces tritici R3-111a-1]|uniref:Uncharacterized protein n=1 Tax=Gaeumannomyces tritici (strain R3-111a-1) TaxID=644352 RepID=J3NJ49_GAET3|nr:hypothetical protein GGTG_01282 [Gaeumannomyces tritici R3-111a-1]EJT81299.1 hypothetical protein GGTG_01282 [Gaeumannomyces tritici R3-111a-1]